MNDWLFISVVGILVFLLVVLIWAAFTLVSGAVLLWAWNTLLVPVVHATALNYWQAVAGVVILQMLGGLFRSYGIKKEA